MERSAAEMARASRGSGGIARQSVVVRRSTRRAKAGMVQRTIVTGHEFGISAKRK